MASKVERTSESVAAATSHPLTFARVADQFFGSQKERLSSASLIRLESMIKRFNAFFQDTTIFANISEKQVRDFIRKRARETAPGSLRLEVGALKRIFRMAVENGLIKTSPASNLAAPREKMETRYLTPDEFCRVRSASPEWLKTIVEFCVATGLTRQELLRVTWEDVIETRGGMLLRVLEGRSARNIPLNRLATQALRSARPQSTPASGRIFTGKSVTSTNVSQAFTRACRSAGVSGVSFKDLRHTSAFWMKQEGVSVETIAQFLGITTLRTAVRYIEGPRIEISKAAAGAIDRIAIRRSR